MIQITADTRRAVVTNKELLTVGSVGIQVQFTLSEDWGGLSKLAVFRSGDDGTKVDIILDNSLTCVVPAEVLRDEDEVLFIGIYGTNGQGTIIIPTLWASAGVVKPGTVPNTPADAQPTPEIWAQILSVANDAEQTATEAMSLVEAGLIGLAELEEAVETGEEQRDENENQRMANETHRNWKSTNFLSQGVEAETRDPGTGATVTPSYGTDPNYPGDSVLTKMVFGIPAGTPGAPGQDGQDGADGQNGVSPAVTISEIAGGHEVTITDADHPSGQSFDVMDGVDGQDGADGADGVIQSVNGKSAASITLDSGDIEFDDSETYAAGSIGAEVSNAKNAISELNRQLNDETTGLDTKAPVIINTASGAIASFDDGADGMPIRKIVGTIVPVQAAGTPSPENQLPISGWTGANITGTCNNLFWYSDPNAQFGKWIAADGTVVDHSRGYISGKIKVEKNAFYYISINGDTPASLKVWEYNGTFFDVSIPITTGGVKTTSASAEYILIAVLCQTGSQMTESIIASHKLQIERVPSRYSTPTSYENGGQIIPINWGSEAGTIYGGTVTLNEDRSVDVVSDMGLDTKSSSDIALRILNNGSSGYNVYRLRMPVEYGDVLISNQYKQYSSVNDAIAAGGGIVIGNKTGSNLYISVVFPWVSGDTNETADARLLANTLQIGYTLATPQTYHFSNIGQLNTFLGTNNVWIDTGAITECDYPADTKLYIDGKIAEMQATILENIGG